MRLLRDALSLFCQALIFPQACCLCHRPALSLDWAPLCRDCLRKLPRFAPNLCPVCGVPSDSKCSRCRASCVPYSRARAYGPYQGELRDLIWNYKYKGLQRLSHPLSQLLQVTYERQLKGRSPDLLVAVPSHRKRVNERGFDHVGRLVGSLSRRLGLPAFKGLRREINTLPQFGLDVEERLRNLKKAFSLSGTEDLDGKAVLLVDDVMTTGTTVLRICELLRDQSSVDRIDVLTVARVPRFQGA